MAMKSNGNSGSNTSNDENGNSFSSKSSNKSSSGSSGSGNGIISGGRDRRKKEAAANDVKGTQDARRKREGFESWKEKRPRILSKYSTNTKIAVTAKFLDEDADKKQNVDRTVERMEELDANKPTEQSKVSLSQKEYIDYIETQHDRMKQAWGDGDRVLALKIAIKCAKLLGDTSVPQFYPSMYILLTDILDTFGDLVFDRIRAKGGNNGRSLPTDFQACDVAQMAVETCRNWFYKIACIRELMPRLYVDLALIKCYRFLEAGENYKASAFHASFPSLTGNYTHSGAVPTTTHTNNNNNNDNEDDERAGSFIVQARKRKKRTMAATLSSKESFALHLQRLARTIRGIGNPLVATYARAYICSKAFDLVDTFSDLTEPMYGNVFSHHHQQSPSSLPTSLLPSSYQKTVLEMVDDFMYTYKHVKSTEFKHIPVLRLKLISKDKYIDLFSPALEWIFQTAGYRSSEDLFFALTEQYREFCGNSAVLIHLIANFQASFISKHAQSMVALIKEATPNAAIPKSKLWLTLGKSLVESAPPKDQLLPILNDVWKVVTKIEDPKEYTEIATVFLQYLLINFSVREVDIFLKDVIKHVKKDDAYMALQEPLCDMVKRMVEKAKDIEKMLTMDHFLPIIDLLEKKVKVEASKVILYEFVRSNKKTAGPVIIHTLFDVSRSLHDSLDEMTFDDEVRQISQSIVSFIRQIDFGRDLEQQLNIYVDCRQSFTRLDAVTHELVLRVAGLAMQAHRFRKGKHNKKTSAFVKACLAYCHITIPSLDNIFPKLRLFLECAQVSLVNGMIGQGEGFVKAAISLIASVPATLENSEKQMVSTTQDLARYLLNLSSFLLSFPGHPRHGPFYLVHLLLNTIEKYPAWTEGCPAKARVYCGVLSLFATYYQPAFPIQIKGVESNDSLYGWHPDTYLQPLSQFTDKIIEKILEQLTLIGQKTDNASAKKDQGTISLELANLLVSSFVMNKTSATMVVKLYKLAVKSKRVNSVYLQNTKERIGRKKGTWYEDIAGKL